MVFSDNFGKILAGLFRAPSSSDSPTFNVEGVLATRTIQIFGTEGFTGRYNFATFVSETQVGKGTQTPTRQDTDIDNPFVIAPEDTFFLNALAGYNSGLGKITAPASLNPTGGSGNISEMIFVITIRATNANNFRCLLTRDIVSPVVSFISGKTINTALEVLI